MRKKIIPLIAAALLAVLSLCEVSSYVATSDVTQSQVLATKHTYKRAGKTTTKKK